MLHRNSSSRRRRASRSTTSSPQTRPRSATTSPGRRASIAVSPVDGDRINRNMLLPDINRSPRHSIIPNISLDSRESSPEELPLSNSGRSPRHSLAPNCLSPRGSIAPDTALSPRNSLVPDMNKSSRHSLVPGDYARSPRNSLVPNDLALSPRNSLVPDYNKSPRNSLVPDSINRSPRPSLTPTDFNRSPRSSLVPESNRSPRPSICTTDWNQPDEYSRSPRHSIIPPEVNRSPRGSIAPPMGSEALRSPRGSIVPPVDRTSPRGSINVEYFGERSPRGSMSAESVGGYNNRSPRGSVGRGNGLGGEDLGRSPRGSLTLTFQEPTANDVRRYSADNTSGNRTGASSAGGGRSGSPYRSARGATNQGYNSTSALSEVGSRRASSSVSQVSGDEQRRLCGAAASTAGGQKYLMDGGCDSHHGLGISLTLTTYGSVAYQLKDANLEANDTCDFVCKALSIVNKTVIVTVVLVCLSTLPLLMLIMGIQFLRDCPREPYIPVYMLVGGSVGCVKMSWLLYTQLHTRRRVPLNSSALDAASIGSRVASHLLTTFLIAWFALGNYWILRIKWPDYAPTLFEPNRWCHRTLYVFACVHLCVVYSVLGGVVALVCVLAGCQLFGCPWLGSARYK